MFSLKLQLLLLLVSLLILFIVINMIRRYSLELKYSLLWLGLSLLTLIMVIFPTVLVWISEQLGIKLPSNALFLFGIIAIFLIVFSLTVALSRSSNKVKDLIQEVGILKHKLEQLEKRRCTHE
jgi:hypothetical protein